MRKITTTIYLSLTILLGNVGMSTSADFQMGLSAAQSGDFATALREWTPLAILGNAAAQFNLGVMYVNGTGVVKDDVYAHLWWSIAASSGDKGAIENRDIVAKQMTPAKIAEVEKLARKCVRKKYIGC